MPHTLHIHEHHWKKVQQFTSARCVVPFRFGGDMECGDSFFLLLLSLSIAIVTIQMQRIMTMKSNQTREKKRMGHTQICSEIWAHVLSIICRAFSCQLILNTCWIGTGCFFGFVLAWAYTTTNPCIQLTIAQLRWDNINTKLSVCYIRIIRHRHALRLFVDLLWSPFLRLLSLLPFFILMPSPFNLSRTDFYLSLNWLAFYRGSADVCSFFFIFNSQLVPVPLLHSSHYAYSRTSNAHAMQYQQFLSSMG